MALGAAGCGHDWSPAADAGDVPADLADVPFEDGPAPDDVGETAEDARTETDGVADAADGDVAAQDADAEDVPLEDAPPVECRADTDCDDRDPCNLGHCDVSTGRCVWSTAADDTPCATGRICCAGSCVDAADLDHCGSCANACADGPHAEPACEGGRCTLRCEAGYLDCDARAPGCESRPTTDEAYCGSCAIACTDGETCWAGACVPSWRPTSTFGAPTPRRQPAGLWTGTRLLVWGGHAGLNCFTSGGRYDPVADAWQAMAVPPGSVALTGCHRFAAVWTGTEMIVLGGTSGTGDISAESGGGRYDPATDRWSPLPATTPDPTRRITPAAVWTGTAMIVWGGVRNRSEPAAADGAILNPLPGSWRTMETLGAPPGSWSAAVVWTGTEMIVWGGWATGTGGALATGGRYDPALDRWTPLAATGAPSARGEARGVWTGREMIVWGGATDGAVGSNPSGPLGDGAAYDPATDTWRPLSAVGAPSPRFQHALVWTGSAMIVWGGMSSAGAPAFGDGAMYDPATDTWTSITNAGAPSARRGLAADWTGEEFVVWGGGSYDLSTGMNTQTDTGGRYRPR